MRRKTLNNGIFICGPTAAGKTAVAVELACYLNTEILSFDSRQFYQELKIGAAPPSSEEREKVKHHFIADRSITENFNAGAYEKEALAKMDELYKKYSNVVLVGGSGLYMKALMHGFDDMPEVSPDIRISLIQEAKDNLQALQEELKMKDREYYNKVDIHNPQRIVRALEIIRGTGETYSSFRKKQIADRNFNCIKIGIELPRSELYDKINRRVDAMIEAGLEEECRHLMEHQENNALQTVGYREFFRYFMGELTLQQAIEEIKKNSRRYAKRQLTWFKRDDEIRWYSPDDVPQMKEFLKMEIEL